MRLIEYLVKKVLSRYYHTTTKDFEGFILYHLRCAGSVEFDWYNFSVPESVQHWSFNNHEPWAERCGALRKEEKLVVWEKLMAWHYFLYRWEPGTCFKLNGEYTFGGARDASRIQSILSRPMECSFISQVDEFQKRCSRFMDFMDQAGSKITDLEIVSESRLDSTTTVYSRLYSLSQLWEFIGIEIIKHNLYKSDE